MRQRFQIVGNEINPAFRELAGRLAHREGVTPEVTAVDWRNLEETFGRRSFDCTLLLGNSMCLLSSARARGEAARNLRAICADGGMLIIDQRNFEYILHNREEILRGQFRYHGEVMYCGTTVKGRPILIEDDCVRFVYEDTREDNVLGYLDMYPLRNGELVALFQKAGFSSVEWYSDLTPGFRADADFYSFVFRC